MIGLKFSWFKQFAGRTVASGYKASFRNGREWKEMEKNDGIIRKMMSKI